VAAQALPARPGSLKAAAAAPGATAGLRDPLPVTGSTSPQLPAGHGAAPAWMLTAAQAAAVIGVRPADMYELARTGLVRTWRRGTRGHRLYHPADVAILAGIRHVITARRAGDAALAAMTGPGTIAPLPAGGRAVTRRRPSRWGPLVQVDGASAVTS